MTDLNRHHNADGAPDSGDAMRSAVDALLTKRADSAMDRMAARPMRQLDFAMFDAIDEAEAATPAAAGWRAALAATWRAWGDSLRARLMVGATAGSFAVAVLIVGTMIWSFRPVGEWRPLDAGSSVGSIAEVMRGGDTLNAGSNGPGLLRLASADVFVGDAAAIEVENGRRLRLDEGELWLEVGKDDAPFVIETPAGEVRVVGTSFGISMKGDRLSMSLLEGEIQLITPTLTRTIRPGESVEVTRGSNELRFGLDGVREPRWLRPVRPLAAAV